MVNCKIVSNKPVCSNCNSNDLSPVRDYKEVQYEDKFAVMFIKRCYNCNKDVAYLVTDIPLHGDNIRAEIVNEFKEVKEQFNE